MPDLLAQASVESPGSIPVTVTLTLRLDEWAKVREQLKTGGHTHYGPAHHVVAAVDAMTRKLEAVVGYGPDGKATEGAAYEPTAVYHYPSDSPPANPSVS